MMLRRASGRTDQRSRYGTFAAVVLLCLTGCASGNNSATLTASLFAPWTDVPMGGYSVREFRDPGKHASSMMLPVSITTAGLLSVVVPDFSTGRFEVNLLAADSLGAGPTDSRQVTSSVNKGGDAPDGPPVVAGALQIDSYIEQVTAVRDALQAAVDDRQAVLGEGPDPPGRIDAQRLDRVEA